jgi:4-amino-4-deoxy-L-arabinose transferase-like glycosyltransferase
MLARLKSLLNPDDPARLPWRMFWVGFVVRVLYMTVAHTYRMRAFGDHFEFGWEMGRIARALATGYGFANPFNGHSGPTAWTPPLYPLILAAVFKVFGVYTLKSAWVILTINSVFSAATAIAIYEIAWRCFGRTQAGLKVALWSGWLWALYPAAMQYAVKWVWDMALTAFLFTCVLLLALRIRGVGDGCQLSVVSSQARTQLTTDNRQLTTSWLLFGVLWGLIALSNSSLLTFLPACGLWMIWPALRTRAHLGRTLRNAALAAVCFAAVISPWVIRNWMAFHAFVPMRSNFGAELYEATIFSSDGFPWMATLPMAESAPEFQRYERIGEIAYSKQQGEVAKARIRAHPDLFFENALRRVDFFWISVPHPTADSGVAVEAIRRINFSFLSFTGFLGLALALRRHIPGAWLFFWAFTLFPLLYYFVTVQARFRHPLEPLICILSVYLFQSADRTRTWSWQKPASAPQ